MSVQVADAHRLAHRLNGTRCALQVADIPGRPLDVLDVFRRPEDLSSHLEDILMAQPKAWFCASRQTT